MDPTSKRLSAYLKRKRVAAGLSQSAVACELGYSSSQMISNWERGLCHPPLSRLKDIARIYRVKSLELIAIMIRVYEKRLYNTLN